jgi:hypothetical protein
MERNNLATPATTSPDSSQAWTADQRRVSVPGGSGEAPEFPGLTPYFDAQLVVSLGPDGEPLSRYGDRRWDLRSMSTDGGQTASYLSFLETQPLSVPSQAGRLDLAALIREQQKALLWLHMDAGRQRAQKTTRQAGRALNQLARGAHRRGISLFELFCDPQALSEESAELSYGYAKSAQAMLRTLWRHRDLLKIEMEIRLKYLVEVIKQSAPEDTECSQTPIIPSRIYCAILARLLSSLDETERAIEPLLDAYRRERSCALNAPSGLAGTRLDKHRATQLEDVREAMRAKGWGGGSLRHFIAGEIIGIQLRLMNVVIALTGMRVAEVLILPLKGVLEEVEHRGSLHHVVNGYSHKLNGGRKKPASWVTTSECHRAIMLAQKISSAVLEEQDDNDSKKGDAALLFGSTANPYKKLNIGNLYSRMHADLIPDICPVITQADIDELNAMELERSWLRDGIEVGKLWPLTFHQYRRSLSVYAHRSGMVSLPALKGQLQHITDEMRAYYSDGFCRAVNLVFDKEHFSHEWNAAKSESSFLAYSLALLFSDEDLIGEIGGRGAARMQEAISSRPKKETLKLFRDGKLAYRETVLGGCIAVDACNQTPLEPIPWDCLEKDCTNAVVFGKRLSLLIKTQEAVVTTLASTESGSVEHRLEAGHLQVLLKARERFTEAV